jgi:hypothetical protein
VRCQPHLAQILSLLGSSSGGELLSRGALQVKDGEAGSGVALNTVKKRQSSPGGVAQWTSHQPQRQQARVRIPPGYKGFRKKSNAVVFLT